MSDHVSVVAFPNNRGPGFDIKSDVYNSWHSCRQTGALVSFENAISIRNQEPRGRCVRMLRPQIAFVADDEFYMLLDDIDTVRELN